MPRIKHLDPQTIAKIAAGEVIERPVSVVKELVENAIDAGATIITVTVEEGGKRLIAITDNGCGMTPDDALLAFEKHATSKITGIDDLEALHSLGFRGEALPSITEVARVTLITRANPGIETESDHSSVSERVAKTAQALHTDSGIEIRMEGGSLLFRREAGTPTGTTVIVENLFFNLPVRKKHMKSPRAEFARIADIMTRFALGHPDISFSLKHNNRRIFSTPRTKDVKNTITGVIGKDLARDLLPILAKGEHASVTGYIAKPSHTRSDRNWIYLFVNGRSVVHPDLADTLRSAYGNLIPRGKFPVGVLYFEIDPSFVDVNIHPSKEKILLFRDYDIIDMLFKAVKETLAERNLIPIGAVQNKKTAARGTQTELVSGADRAPSMIRETAPPYAVTGKNPDTRIRHLPHQTALGSTGMGEGVSTIDIHGAAQGDSSVRAERTTDDRQGKKQEYGRLPPMRPIAQIMNLYILAEGDDGLYIIDQHAIHEKALFERFMKKAEREEQDGAAQRQPLIEPVTFALPSGKSDAFDSLLPSLRSLGFEIEPFGRGAFIVKAIPAPLTSTFDRDVMESIIAEVLDSGKSHKQDELREQVSALMACHTAIRAGKNLSMPEITSLLEEVAQAEHPFACPHGRPTIVHFSEVDLEKMFKRR